MLVIIWMTVGIIELVDLPSEAAAVDKTDVDLGPPPLGTSTSSTRSIFRLIPL